MSPASAGTLEVERYIGACLISQQNRNREFTPNYYHRHQNFVNLQRCPVDGWAGGMPLISFANQRRPRRDDRTDDASPLARLAVHTQGAPLILAKTYNHRKNKLQRTVANVPVQQTKIFENSNKKQQNKGVDAISVTSDESSGSQSNENCLPRIIKPRKRRKKDRKPPHLARTLSQDDFSTSDSASPDIQPPNVNYFPFIDHPDSNQLFDLLGDISETPKLHHRFEDVEEIKDINGNQPATTCQCRYCDPSGQIWDVDRSCYSPFLTPPTEFKFPNLNLDGYSSLVHSLSSVSLDETDTKRKTPFSRSSSSSSTSSTRDLEVSTEIVTSLNGHRDLEIKFFTSSVVVEKERTDKDAVNSVCKLLSTEE